MAELPKSVLQRLKSQAAPQDHPDADLLAAFSEQALTGRERENVLAHLAVCSVCREAVALATPPPPEVQPAGVFVPWYRRPQIFAWAGSLATLALVGALILNYSQTRYVPSTFSDATASKAVATPAAQNQPAAPVEKKAQTRADVAAPNGSLGGLRKEETERDVNLTKLVPKQKATQQEHASRVMAPPPAAVPPPSKDQKVLDGGALQSQYRAAAKEPAPAVPAAAPAAGVADSIAENRQASTAQTITVESAAAAPAKSADVGASAGAVGGAVLRHKAMKTAPAILWSIDDKGKLQKSLDSGRTWQPVLVNSVNDVFRVVVAIRWHVFVGGNDCALYFSHKSGEGWGKQTLPGCHSDIVGLQFSDEDAMHGTARASDGSVWTTDDSGHNWTRQ